MVTKIRRISNLAELLKTRPCSVQYIMRHLGMSERQVYRDLQLMRALDYPIIKSKHQYSITNGKEKTHPNPIL